MIIAEINTLPGFMPLLILTTTYTSKISQIIKLLIKKNTSQLLTVFFKQIVQSCHAFISIRQTSVIVF